MVWNIYCKVYHINFRDIILILGFIMLDFIILGPIIIDVILEFNIVMLKWFINLWVCIKYIDNYINMLINVY